MKTSTEEISRKYTLANDQAIKPGKATIDSAGHDLFAAETKILQPGSCNGVSLELNMEIPKGFFGKIYPRSGLLLNHFVSCDEGVIIPAIKELLRLYDKSKSVSL